MKPASDALIALLASQQFKMADLYSFTLVDGVTVLRYTSYDKSLTYGGFVFSASGPIISRGQLRNAVGVEVSTLDIDIAVTPDVEFNGVQATVFVGNGGFDGARVRLDRAFMPLTSPRDTSAGVLNQFTGRVGEVESSRSNISLTVNSDMELLNIRLPRNIYQAGCIHSLYDAGCTLLKGDFESATTVAASSTKLLINCDLAEAAGYFDLGTITFDDGPNAGISRTVKSYVPGALTLSYPLPYLPETGDALKAYPGCDKTLATCEDKFNNRDNNRSFPFTPAPETTY